METVTNTRVRESMKFVINGRTFHTATATTVAVARGVDVPDAYSPYSGAEQVQYEDVLHCCRRLNIDQ